MIRTQISLSEKEYAFAKIEAKKQGISFAELLRRSLRSIITNDNKKSWMRYCGFIESNNKKSSQQIDDLIYGQKG